MKFGTYQKVKDLKAGMKNYDQKKYRNNHDIHDYNRQTHPNICEHLKCVFYRFLNGTN